MGGARGGEVNAIIDQQKQDAEMRNDFKSQLYPYQRNFLNALNAVFKGGKVLIELPRYVGKRK